jgi:hypothetical protein
LRTEGEKPRRANPPGFFMRLKRRPTLASRQLQRPVIITMASVHMVQVAIDQIIDMIAVRHRFMAAAGAVHMAAGQRGGTAIGIGRGYRDHMFIDMIAMRVMQMAIMQIINMAFVVDGGVAATGPMHMGMAGVGVGATHGCSPSGTRSLPPRRAAMPLRPSRSMAKHEPRLPARKVTTGQHAHNLQNFTT